MSIIVHNSNTDISEVYDIFVDIIHSINNIAGSERTEDQEEDTDEENSGVHEG